LQARNDLTIALLLADKRQDTMEVQQQSSGYLGAA